MARFDVYPQASRPGFLLDVQSDHLAVLPTRMVVPLLPEGGPLPPLRDLNPVFDVAGQRVTLLTQYMAAVPARQLRHPIASLAEQGAEITRAIDMLLTGF